jgi:hypothetical protein
MPGIRREYGPYSKFKLFENLRKSAINLPHRRIFVASGAQPMKPILRLLDTIAACFVRDPVPSLYQRCLAVHLHHASTCRSFSA